MSCHPSVVSLHHLLALSRGFLVRGGQFARRPSAKNPCCLAPVYDTDHLVHQPRDLRLQHSPRGLTVDESLDPAAAVVGSAAPGVRAALSGDDLTPRGSGTTLDCKRTSACDSHRQCEAHGPRHDAVKHVRNGRNQARVKNTAAWMCADTTKVTRPMASYGGGQTDHRDSGRLSAPFRTRLPTL